MVPRPLRGTRVLELGQFIAAPVCAQLLADFGAEVTKVEPPDGDGSRHLAATAFGSLYTRSFNTGKASVALDLRSPRDRARLTDLLAASDALVVNLAPAALRRANLTWPEVHARHPRLVMTVVSGYGLHDDRTCMDTVAQCETGFAAFNGDAEGAPRVSAGWPTDVLSGLYAGISTAMALLDAERREGVLVDVSMMEVATAALMGPAALLVMEDGKPAAPSGNRDRASAPSSVYRCRDGHAYIYAGIDHYWARLRAVVDGPDLTAEQRLAQADAIDAVVERWTSARPVAEVLRVMRDLAIPAGAVVDPTDAVRRTSALRPLAVASRLPSGEAVPSYPVLFSGARPPRSPAPALGGPRRDR